MTALTTSIQHYTGGSSQGKLDWKKRRASDYKGRSKTISVDDMNMRIEKSQGIHQKLLELINEFSQVADCKINI